MKTTFTRSIESAMKVPSLFVFTILLVGCELSEPIQGNSGATLPLISSTLLSEPPSLDPETGNYYQLSLYSHSFKYSSFDLQEVDVVPLILQELIDSGYSVVEGWYWYYEKCFKEDREIAPGIEFVVSMAEPYQNVALNHDREGGGLYWFNYSAQHQYSPFGTMCDDGGITYHYTITQPSE